MACWSVAALITLALPTVLSTKSWPITVGSVALAGSEYCSSRDTASCGAGLAAGEAADDVDGAAGRDVVAFTATDAVAEPPHAASGSAAASTTAADRARA